MATHAPAPTRHYLPAQLEVNTFEDIKAYYEELLARELPTLEALKQWMADADELQAFLQENLAWRYIRMTCDTTNEAAVKAYQSFVEHVAPQATELGHKLTEKYYNSPLREQLEGPAYAIYNRQAANEIELFREENIPLNTEISLKSREYGTIAGAMSITHEGQELTLQQASQLLERPDRALRETIWHAIQDRRAQDRIKLDELLDELIALRTQVANNAGYDSYTDYKYQELGRFDYGRKEVTAFHHAIAGAVTPFNDRMLALQKNLLGLDTLRPWDTAIDPHGQAPLQPFTGSEELIDKSRAVLAQLDPHMGNMLATMKDMGHLDLESRKGKAPGGYNYPLMETGVPFIFMNAVGTQSDLTTMVHEAGHAVHAFLSQPLPLTAFRDTPSEVAELASMAMELLSMNNWHIFYDKPAQLRRAKLKQIDRSISVLPWIATVDAFQHWLYDKPNHTHAQRHDKWLELHKRFMGTTVDWTGLDVQRAHGYQRQLHIYEVPFYYIEYGIAQLGALQVWRNYSTNPQQGLADYTAALKLGYTRPIPEIYATAGIRFDFTEAMIAELLDFVETQLEALNYKQA